MVGLQLMTVLASENSEMLEVDIIYNDIKMSMMRNWSSLLVSVSVIVAQISMFSASYDYRGTTPSLQWHFCCLQSLQMIYPRHGRKFNDTIGNNAYVILD